MMNEEYCKSIGFMCGLEIHQRIDSKEKLFCNCSTHSISDDEVPVGSIYRYQRAVSGETGKIDIAAKIEEQKKKRYVYNIFKNNSCLVDIDEEPPHDMNREALQTALEIASSFNMIIFNELEPMRKEVVDGSNTSAFQRTTMLGLNGYITVNNHKVNITSMMIEEESAGIVSNSENTSIYNTDRLGIPLVEIDTDPYIRTSSEAKDVALYIGTLLRITGKVQRGIGTIRQDVNVSIKGGSRVEIKGFQDLANMDKYIENEVIRQQNLIKIKEELQQRKFIFKFGEIIDLSPIFKNTKSSLISKALSKNEVILGVKISSFKDYLGKEVNPNRRLGSEVSDYAKLAGVNGIIHADEDLIGKYHFSDDEIKNIKTALSIDDKDSFIIVAAEKQKAENAINFAISRIRNLSKLIPLETRATYDSNLFTTRFMRPIAGGSRMYPETDSKPILITDEMKQEAELMKPNLESAINELRDAIKDETMVKKLLLSPKYQLYKEISASIEIDKKMIADILMQKFTEMRREGIDVDSINDTTIKYAFELYKDGELTKKGIVQLLKIISKESKDADKAELSKILDNNKLKKLNKEELLKIVKEFKEKDEKNILSAIMKDYNIVVEADELKELIDTNKDIKFTN